MNNRFLVYNVFENELLYDLISYVEMIESKEEADVEIKDDIVFLVKDIIDFSSTHGFYGNLFKMLITYFLLMDENPYTLSIERFEDKPKKSIYNLALNDIKILKQVYDYDFNKLGSYVEMDFSELLNYEKTHSGVTFSESIRDIMTDISNKLSKAEDEESFIRVLNDFYSQYGVGDIGLHKAFRVNEDGSLYPINNISKVLLSDLIGLTDQKEELLKNTKAFLESRPANNCLLYGDAGTGKSSSIKAIANEFFEEGLRIVEIYKHQFKSLNDVIAKIKGRNYRFILYMDDLSFEEFETEYKYLKAVIEGGLENKPSNILIYATSNRRHLVRESFNDRNDDIHRADTMQEKLSLYNRFGVTIYFGAPDKKEFNEIVIGLRDRYEVNISDEEILAKANTWEVYHGGRSGRSAKQFVDYIRGES